MIRPPAPGAPSAAELLDAWERASGESVLARPLVLLAGVGMGSSFELADLPIGSRNSRLLALHTALFGSTLPAAATCPECHEVAEFDVAVPELVKATPSSTVGTVEVDGHVVSFTLPTTADLVAVVDAAPSDARAAGALLLQRCAGPLPDGGAIVVEAAIEAGDPLADAVLDVGCPSCGENWSAPLDVAAFVWSEVDAWSERTLGEVDVLARAYGWPEPEVLALSPWRRRRYLELASG